MESQSDEKIFERYRQTADASLFRVIVDRHHDDLIRFLNRLMGDAAGAEDVFQEAFLQVHTSQDSFDASRKFRPWLFTIAANKARDYMRKKGRRKTLDLSAPLNGSGDGSDGNSGTFIDLMEIRVPSPDARLNDEETSAAVQKVLDQLPYALREILLLSYFQRLTYAQIADELEIPLGTVKSRLHSAVASFAKKWSAAQPTINS